MNEFLAGVTLCLFVRLCECVRACACLYACVSVNEPYRAEMGGPHHSFTRSFYSHSESPRKPSVCV